MNIWKYELDIANEATLDMPEGAKVLTVQTQEGVCCIWAQVDASKPKVKRHFSVYGTGQPLPQNPGIYLGTFQLHGGQLVFHVFERIENVVSR